ncbi:asparagine synthase (glutamine-hydrolyzing) [Rhodanobacter sp. DHG33]|uniref:asparagine synthase (glutamine-hydrolyzing) n=1 Tax=Rhodanobacter sp. DHG33 TaxID=2775921 RepID=UPI001CE0FF5D|nr:asparagine synthase (glutamine-hydrolyzing) [Rhodanobacter sp. DHG33]
MCGIGGVLMNHQEGSPDAIVHQVQAMLSAMRHRGPDGQAEYSAENIAMGANRLAIRGVDRVQPPLFVHASGVVVICNGEIDNHRTLRASLAVHGHTIESGSDIAVIAPLYLEKGLSFLEHLDGVFALALWDPRQRRLILARDRTGERHLYYATSTQGLWFASELAALQIAAPADTEVDRQSLAYYLRSGYCPSPRTPFVRRFKVCPGEMIVQERNKTRYMRYWTSPIGRKPTALPSASTFDAVFRNAIVRQTDVDVDYGVLLSGGLDSSLITAVARQVRPAHRLKAYCIRFEESSFDEASGAQTVAGRYDCPLATVTLGAAQVPQMLRHLIRTTGEPLADPAWLPLFLVTERASCDVKMLLAGEGADELFGGYPTYLGALWSSQYGRLPATVRKTIRSLVTALPVSDKKMALSFLLKKFVDGQEHDGLTRHLLWNANLSPDWIRRLGMDHPLDQIDHSELSLLDLVQNHDFGQSLPDALMAKADRGGMCHGVEIRAPFLDRTVIEYASTLPADARIKRLRTKAFLKDYARRYLPAEIIERRKRGLSVPLGPWLRGPLRCWAMDKLSSKALSDAGIQVDAALALMEEHIQRRNDHARGLWNLIVLSEWLEWTAEMRNNTLSTYDLLLQPALLCASSF